MALAFSEISKKVASSIIVDYVKKKGATFLGLDRAKFTKELESVIYSTIDEFESKYHIEVEGNKFPFYHSEILLQELLSIKFLGRDQIDSEELMSLLATNSNIIQPKKSSVETFLNLFEENCKKSSVLINHQFNDNYREAIFAVLDLVDSINTTLNKMIFEMKSSLKTEYYAQLEEIQLNINAFKPKTALERLNTIEKRIIQNSQFTSEIESKILYLKGICLLESEKDIKGAEFIVSSYLKNKIALTRPDAALAYLNLNDPDKAKQLADQIISEDPFHVIGWLVLIFVSGDKYLEVLKIVPPAVKNKMGFNVSLISYLLKYFNITNNDISILGLKVPEEIDENITHANKARIEITGEIMLMLYFQVSKEFNFDSQGKVYYDKKGLPQLLLVLDKLYKAIVGSEVQNSFLHLRFYYYFIRHILGDYNFDKDDFKDMHAKLRGNAFFYDLHYSEYLANSGRITDALEIIENSKFNRHEVVSLHRIFYNIVAGKKHIAQNIFRDHIGDLKNIAFEDLINILYFFKLFLPDIDLLRKEYENILSTRSFQNNDIKSLYRLTVQIRYFKDEINKEKAIEELFELGKMYKENKNVILHLSQMLLRLEAFDKCIEIIEPLVVKGTISVVNITFTQAIYKSGKRLQELLKILQEIRLNNDFVPFEFLALEFELRSKIDDTNSIILICQKGIKQYPDNEDFHYNLLSALEKKQQPDGIEDYVKNYYKDQFKNENFGVWVSTILSRNGFPKEGSNLLFNLASNSSNHTARTNYVACLTHPVGFFIDYDVVEELSNIKIVDETGKVKLVIVKASDRFQKLIGKKIGDTILIPAKVGQSLKSYTVIRVMNLQLFLLEQILEEATDSESNLGIHSINFSNEQGELDIKAFEEYFIGQYSVDESIRKGFIDKLIQSYNLRKESFGDLSNQIFNGDFLECYQFLTHQGFYALPAFYNSNLHFAKEEVFAIDFTTLILFSDLKSKYQLTFPMKFIVSTNLGLIIKNELTKLKTMPAPKMRLTIVENQVRSVFYPEDFQKEQTDKYTELLAYINEHCSEKIIEEKIELAFQVQEKFKNDIYFKYQIDNTLFATNLNYVLISNDTFPIKYFQSINPKQVSPENFLLRFYRSALPETITNYCIENNYLGIEINSDILIREFKKHKSNQPNSFHNCIANLKFRISLSPNIFSVGIKFLKEIYLNDLSLDNEKYLLAQSIFTNLLDGCSHNQQIILIIRQSINIEFRLLGESFDTVVNAFEATLEMYQRKL